MAEKSKIEKIIKEVESLSVLELNQLVKALEEKFGVQAQVVTPIVSAPATTEETKTEEKAVVDLVLKTPGKNKISVIKTARQIKPDLGLKEAKDLVESAPKVLLKEVNKKEAEEAKKKLEEVGAQAELK